MLTGPQRKFCEGIVSGLPATDAYRAAYPKASVKSIQSNATRTMGNDGVKAEIARLRAKADEMAGSAVLTLAEKRSFLARAVRAKIVELPEDSDLYVSVESTEFGRKFRLPDKLAAIKLDNDLAGEGSEAEKNDALAGLLERVMK